MSKKRVHEIAKEFGVESKQVISILQQNNINVTKAVNSVDDSGYEIVKKQLGKKAEAPKVVQKTEKTTLKDSKKNRGIRTFLFGKRFLKLKSSSTGISQNNRLVLLCIFAGKG